MSYVALYRKYRPQTFADVVAQDHIVQTLGNALQRNHLSHAYLLAGPRGTGKTTVARILAKAVNCRPRVAADGTEPCNECPSCTAVAEGKDLDVLEIDAASNRGIDEIRDLREKVHYAPVRSPFKVYIVDEVHMLTNEAFNAFLKTLEDPPAHCVFIFATTDPQKLPATILSRCQRFDFHQVPPRQIIARLKHICALENITAEDQALVLIARHARGGMRDALALLDQARAMAPAGRITIDMLMDALGAASEATLLELTAAAVTGDAAAGLSIIHQLMERGRDARQFLRDWVEHLRNLLVIRTIGAKNSRDLIMSSEDMQAALAAQAAQISAADLLRAVTYLSERDQVIHWAPDGRIVLESAWLHFLDMLPHESSSLSPSIPASAPSPSPSDTMPLVTPSSAAAEPAVSPAPSAPSPPASAAVPSAPSPPASAPAPSAPSPPAPAAAAAPQSAASDPLPPPARTSASMAPAAAPAAPLPAASNWGLAEIQSHWPAFCNRVRAEDSLLAVYLHKGRPTNLTGARLTLSYAAGDYAAERMVKVQGYRRLAAQLLQRLWGVKWSIDVVTDPARGGAADIEVAAADDGDTADQRVALPAVKPSAPGPGFVQEALRLLDGRLINSEPPLRIKGDDNSTPGGINS